MPMPEWPHLNHKKGNIIVPVILLIAIVLTVVGVFYFKNIKGLFDFRSHASSAAITATQDRRWGTGGRTDDPRIEIIGTGSLQTWTASNNPAYFPQANGPIEEFQTTAKLDNEMGSTIAQAKVVCGPDYNKNSPNVVCVPQYDAKGNPTMKQWSQLDTG